MELERSSPCVHKPATGPCPEPDESGPHSNIIFSLFKIHFSILLSSKIEFLKISTCIKVNSHFHSVCWIIYATALKISLPCNRFSFYKLCFFLEVNRAWSNISLEWHQIYYCPVSDREDSVSFLWIIYEYVNFVHFLYAHFIMWTLLGIVWLMLQIW
jgi:hypothetical protein